MPGAPVEQPGPGLSRQDFETWKARQDVEKEQASALEAGYQLECWWQ